MRPANPLAAAGLGGGDLAVAKCDGICIYINHQTYKNILKETHDA
jgi:hypothetical protein